MPDTPDVFNLDQRVKRLEDDRHSMQTEIKDARTRIEQLLIDQAVQGAQYANILQEIKSLRTDFATLKDRPGRRWDVVVAAVITGIVSVGITLLMGGLN